MPGVVFLTESQIRTRIRAIQSRCNATVVSINRHHTGCWSTEINCLLWDLNLCNEAFQSPTLPPTLGCLEVLEGVEPTVSDLAAYLTLRIEEQERFRARVDAASTVLTAAARDLRRVARKRPVDGEMCMVTSFESQYKNFLGLGVPSSEEKAVQLESIANNLTEIAKETGAFLVKCDEAEKTGVWPGGQ